jgi:hypothetical protein
MSLEDLALWIACGGAIVVGISFNMIGWALATSP